MKVLCVKTSSMGDVIHTLPALRDATHAFPALQIDWVVEESFSEIPRWSSSVHRVIPVALRKWRRHPWSSSTRDLWHAFRKQLQHDSYDYVIDAQGLLKSAVIACMARGMRCGYQFFCARESWASLLYHKAYRISVDQHAILRIRQLFSCVLGYELQGPPDYGIDRQQLPVLSIKPPSPYVVFLHGTSRANKCWPEDYWIALARWMKSKALNVLLFWGSEQERLRAKRIAHHLDHVHLMPCLSLGNIAQLMLKAKTVVALDTGLGHLSCALEVPTVSLYGPTDTRLIGMLGQHQQRCQRACMEDITVNQVQCALEELWRGLDRLN